MSSYLGYYEGATSFQEKKFHRAVKSFINQDLESHLCELIISSDGCTLTNYLYEKYYSKYQNIKLVKNTRQGFLYGIIRQNAIHQSLGKIICFLDTDDYIGKHHLSSIQEGIRDCDWCYWDDYVYTMEGIILRNTEIEFRKCGTSTIAYKKSNLINWTGYNGYGHDYYFINEQLNKDSFLSVKIYKTFYLCCHIPGIIDM